MAEFIDDPVESLRKTLAKTLERFKPKPKAYEWFGGSLVKNTYDPKNGAWFEGTGIILGEKTPETDALAERIVALLNGTQEK